MRLRLTGLAGEVDQAVEQLGDVFEVVDVSAVYPCRGRSELVRVYVEVRLGARPGRGASADAAAVGGGRAGAELETAPTRPATTTTTATGDEGRWMR